MAEQSEGVKQAMDLSDFSNSMIDSSMFNQEAEENKSWTDIQKLQVIPNDGPRDSTHGAVQDKSRLEDQIRSQLDKDQIEKRKNEISNPIEVIVPDGIREAVKRAKRIIEQMQQRQYSGSFRDQIKKKNITMQDMVMMTPKEWNNVPIPIADGFTCLMNFAQNIHKISVHQENDQQDLCNVTKSLFDYIDYLTNDIREKASAKFNLLNTQTEDQMANLKGKLLKNDQKVQFNAIDVANTDSTKALIVMKQELLNMVEERLKRQHSTMLKEIDVKIKKGVKNGLLVPNMIGENCEYSTFANFILQFHDQTKYDTKMNKVKVNAQESRIDELDQNFKIYKKELEGILNRLEESRKEMLTCQADISRLRSQIYDMSKVKPFTEFQMKKLKGISDRGWDDMQKKLASVNNEVFEQVMEQEMALAKMESVEFDSDQFKRHSTKSLLLRMHTFKTSLVAKQKRNEAQKYDSSASMSGSSIEEEDSSPQNSSLQKDSKRRRSKKKIGSTMKSQASSKLNNKTMPGNTTHSQVEVSNVDGQSGKLSTKIASRFKSVLQKKRLSSRKLQQQDKELKFEEMAPRIEKLEVELKTMREKPSVCEKAVKDKLATLQYQLFLINSKLRPYKDKKPSPLFLEAQRQFMMHDLSPKRVTSLQSKSPRSPQSRPLSARQRQAPSPCHVPSEVDKTTSSRLKEPAEAVPAQPIMIGLQELQIKEKVQTKRWMGHDQITVKTVPKYPGTSLNLHDMTKRSGVESSLQNSNRQRQKSTSPVGDTSYLDPHTLQIQGKQVASTAFCSTAVLSEKRSDAVHDRNTGSNMFDSSTRFTTNALAGRNLSQLHRVQTSEVDTQTFVKSHQKDIIEEMKTIEGYKSRHETESRLLKLYPQQQMVVLPTKTFLPDCPPTIEKIKSGRQNESSADTLVSQEMASKGVHIGSSPGHHTIRMNRPQTSQNAIANRWQLTKQQRPGNHSSALQTLLGGTSMQQVGQLKTQQMLRDNIIRDATKSVNPSSLSGAKMPDNALRGRRRTATANLTVQHEPLNVEFQSFQENNRRRRN